MIQCRQSARHCDRGGHQVRCAWCGDRYHVRVRCTVELPACNCESPESRPHTHILCSRCRAERLTLPDAGELALAGEGGK
jgi:hypothetical protein